MTPKKMLLAIGAIAIVLIVIVAAAALMGGSNNGKADDQGSDQQATREASNSQMAIKVLGITDPYQADAPMETFMEATNGSHYVLVQVSLENKMADAGSAPALFWSLWTSDGLTHTVCFTVGNDVPSGIQGKATSTFYLPYEVANGTTPTKLVYNGASTLEIEL